MLRKTPVPIIAAPMLLVLASCFIFDTLGPWRVIAVIGILAIVLFVGPFYALGICRSRPLGAQFDQARNPILSSNDEA